MSNSHAHLLLPTKHASHGRTIDGTAELLQRGRRRPVLLPSSRTERVLPFPSSPSTTFTTPPRTPLPFDLVLTMGRIFGGRTGRVVEAAWPPPRLGWVEVCTTIVLLLLIIKRSREHFFARVLRGGKSERCAGNDVKGQGRAGSSANDAPARRGAKGEGKEGRRLHTVNRLQMLTGGSLLGVAEELLTTRFRFVEVRKGTAFREMMAYV